MSRIFERLFGGPTGPSSKDEAKQRLKVLLIHDQVDLTPAQLDRMKSEILDVINRYCDVNDESEVELTLDRDRTTVVLHSTIPVRRVTARA